MYFQRKSQTRVYVYITQNGSVRVLPRALTKHLDGKADWEIDDWMRWFSALNSIEHRTPLKVDLGETQALLERYLRFLKSQKKHPNTIAIHEARLLDVLPFFGLKPKFNEWYMEAGKLYDWLLAKGWNPHRINRCNMAFRGFYKWLQLQNIVQHRHALMLVNAVMEGRNTPLKFTLTPDQVLAFAASQGATDLGLMALVGYFFSLRTDELFGLRKEDFLAGSRAEALEASKVMKKRGLYHRLVIYVRQCRRASGEIYAPTKRKRGGFVACFDETAARKIVKVISALPDGLLFTQHTPGHYSKVWSANGITDITLKDLRRASLYYLGHYSDLNFVDLQNHARHNNPTTTALYTRRPEEAFDEGGENLLDLDA